MKKFIASVLAASALFAGSAVLAADNDVTVTLNGTEMTFDIAPFIEDGRTLVPMRALFEAVGASVTWDNDTETVISCREKDGVTTFVSLQVGSTTAFINEEKTELEVPAVLIDDSRTFVPLRFVIESLGETVEWDEATNTVIITTTEESA